MTSPGPATPEAPPEEGHHASPEDRTGELLDEIPHTDHHLGRFAGYRAADRVRRRMAAALALAGIAAVVAYRQYVAWAEYYRDHPFELAEDPEGVTRPRELHWSGGRARLGLARSAPGVQVIYLPDRRIELAPGSPRAQIKVDEVDGQTRVRVLTGDILQFDLEGHPLPPED